MLKSEFLVLKSGGGPKSYILKSGGAVAPPAPLVLPPMNDAAYYTDIDLDRGGGGNAKAIPN